MCDHFAQDNYSQIFHYKIFGSAFFCNAEMKMQVTSELTALLIEWCEALNTRTQASVAQGIVILTHVSGSTCLPKGHLGNCVQKI